MNIPNLLNILPYVWYFVNYTLILGWMNERHFRPLFCTVEAELGQRQPGLLRWIWDETLPLYSIDRSTLHTVAHRAIRELRAASTHIRNNTSSLLSLSLTIPNSLQQFSLFLQTQPFRTGIKGNIRISHSSITPKSITLCLVSCPKWRKHFSHTIQASYSVSSFS